MPETQQQPPFDPATFPLYSRENFYTPEDFGCAARDWPRDEVENAFKAYRAAIDVGDHATMAAMLTEGGRAGNTTFGFFHDREAYREFLETCWLEIIRTTTSGSSSTGVAW